MRLTADRIGVLVEHGLTDNQARVYLALLEYPALTAGPLAKAASIPRNRLYEVLEELQAMGLVEILLDETRKYRALPLCAYLERNVSDLKERIQRIEAQRERVAAAFQPPDATEAGELEAGATRALLTRRAVAREIDRMIEGARASVLAVGSSGGWLRLASHLDKTPDAVLARGAVELYLPRSVVDAGGAARMPPAWRDAARALDVPLRTLAVVVDEREMMLVHPMPDDEAVRAGRDFALLTTNAGLVRDHLDLVRKAAAAGAAPRGGDRPAAPPGQG